MYYISEKNINTTNLEVKMINIKRFIKTAGIYLLGSVLSKLVSFFLLPIYTSNINPVEMGEYDLVFSFINLIAPIAFLQIWDSLFRFSFDTDEKQNKYALVNNSIFVCLFGVGIYLIFWIFLNIAYNFDYFYLVVLYGLLFAVQYVYTFSARAFLKNGLYVFSGVISTIVTAILNIVLIVAFGFGINAMYISAIVGILVQIILIELDLKLLKNLNFKDINKPTLKSMISFSIPLCVATVSYWLLSGYSKIIINYFLGDYDNGMYAVANKFASMITIFVSVFQFAWNETAYLMANDDNRKSVYEQFVNFILKVVFWGTAIVIIGIKIIFPYFVDEIYYQSLNIVPAAIIGTALNSVAGFLGTLFSTEKKTSFIMTSTIIASIFNIIAAVVGAKHFGLQGVVVALMISFVLLLVIRLWKLTMDGNIKIKFATIFSLFPLCITVFLFYNISNMITLWVIIFLLLIFFVFYIRNDLKMFIMRRKK